MAKKAGYKLSWKKFFKAAGAPGYMLLGYHIVMVFLTRQRSFNDVAAVDGSALIQIIMAVAAFIISASEISRNKVTKQLLTKTPLKWLMLYGLWSLLSMLWSVSPSMTGYRAFETIAYLMLFGAVISRLYKKIPIDGIVQWVINYAVFVIVLSLFKRWYAYGMDLSFETLLMEQMGTTPYFFLVLLLPVGLLAKFLILPISILSVSNTAYAGILLGFTTLYKGKKWVRTLFAAGILAAVIFIFSFGFEKFLLNTVFYDKEGVGMEYTTGRDQIFTYSFNAAMQKPFTGYGFMAGETYIVNKEYQATIGAHNGLISALLGGGFPAAILFVILFGDMLRTANSRYLPPNYKAAFLATVILITIHTLGNPGIGSRMYGTWMPAVMIFTLISMVQLHYKKTAQHAHHLGHP